MRRLKSVPVPVRSASKTKAESESRALDSYNHNFVGDDVRRLKSVPFSIRIAFVGGNSGGNSTRQWSDA